MPEETVRKQLAEALEELADTVSDYSLGRATGSDVADAIGKARLALDRHRTEPEGGVFRRREALLVALDELFKGPYFEGVDPDLWEAAREAFKAAISELQCPDGCDTSCRCYQEGLEAQRERVGGGTA